jgi:RNA recognition motif-containing protein
MLMMACYPIGALVKETTKERLREIFQGFGEITGVDLPVRENGDLKGFGFVRFAVVENAAAAIEALNGANCVEFAGVKGSAARAEAMDSNNWRQKA